MFIAIDKKTVFFMLTIVLGLVLLVFCGTFHAKHEKAKTASAVPIVNKVIVIDAGHGGFDAGASDNNLVEKDINLDIALRLMEYIEHGGGVAQMTRIEDVSTADTDRNGKSAKQSDLEERKKLASSADADVFISIHINKFGQPQYKGAQVFYGEGTDDSKRLGDTIQETMKEIIADGNERTAKKIDGQVYILKNTSIPSVIVECGFLSNPQEAELLRNEDYRQKLAWSIYLGVLKYFNNADI